MSDKSITKVMQRLFIFATVILLSFQGFMVNMPNVQAEEVEIEVEAETEIEIEPEPEIEPALAKPEVEEVTDQSKEVAGKAEAKSIVIVKVNGKEIGQAVTNEDGKFKVEIEETQKAGTELTITATNEAGNTSEATVVTVIDITAPEKPEVNNDVTNLSKEVTGKAEAGSTVKVSANKKVIGSKTAEADGTFIVTIPAQKAGKFLSITATDNAENVSEAETVTVGAVTEKSTSFLGHINAGESHIYPNSPGEVNKVPSEKYASSVYYIKKQATYQDETYYLLSEEPNATKGVIGWMKATDVTTHKHSGVNKKKKTFYVKGTGGAGFDTAWGGSKNEVYADLKLHKNKTFAVNLTEKVGNNIWYRGILNGKQTWIHSNYVAELNSYIELSTSRLGHIKAGKSSVYSTPFNTADKKSSESFKDSVYYIKKQATYNKELYYLLSNEPSAEKGVIGWMKASEVSSHAHAGMNKKKQTLYVKGTGGAGYNRAWGGGKNHVYADLKKLKGAQFTVNLTEKIGNNVWHRGLLNGKQTWVHSNYLTELSAVYKEQSTSRLGHINAGKSSVYTTPYNKENAKSSEGFKDSVYYIKKQATFSGDLYYLLSTQANATKGVIGWMKASDVSSHVHKGMDKKKKMFYVKGTGGAGFDTAWGGSKNNVYTDLKPLENEIFHVNLTEKIGNNTWYRGLLNGKQTWIHSNFVEDITGIYKEQSTSRLGHIKGDSVIYASPFEKATESSERYEDSVYYIKKQATFKGQLYYLLSSQPSATKGVIGWMKASDVSSHTHVGVDKKAKTFYVKGTGGASFDTAWGGSNNSGYADLKLFKDETFSVNLTEKIGNNIWYRGMLNGKQTWIHSSYVATSK